MDQLMDLDGSLFMDDIYDVIETGPTPLFGPYCDVLNSLGTFYAFCSEGSLAIWADDDNEAKWFSRESLCKAAEYTEDKRDNVTVFFAVCLRREKTGISNLAGAENLLICPGIWVDIEFQDKPEGMEGPHKMDEEVAEFIESFDLKPSLIGKTRSGDYQAHFLFESPFIVEDNESRETLQTLFNDLHSAYKQHAESLGWNIHTTPNIDGYLEIPATWHGSYNPVGNMIDPSYLNTYSLEELRAAVDSFKSRVALEGDQEDLVLTQCDDAPVKPEAVVPFGWTIEKNELRQKAGNDLVTPQSIFISSKYENLQDGSLSLELVYRYGGKWKRTCLPRYQATQPSTLKQCANFGMKITPKNAPRIAEYLAAYEEANLQAGIREYYSSSKFGWQKTDGKDVFLLGHKYFSVDGNGPIDTSKSQEDLPDGTVVFSSAKAGHGTEALAEAFVSKGTYENWLEAAKLISSKDPALLCFYAAFVPPLMDVLDIPNFIVDICYKTSSGKTTLQLFLASLYGKPDQSISLMQNWNMTRIYAEELSAVLYGLPMILNDTKSVKDKKIIEEVIYDITNESTHGRGSTTGMRARHHIKTVLISSGETPMVSLKTSPGVKTRTISLAAPPFSAIDEKTAQMVSSLRTIINDNYGIAGEKFIGYLVRNRATKTEEWEKRHDELRKHYARKANGNPFIGRLGEYFAAIDLAGLIVHEALELPWDFRSPIEPLWEIVTFENEDPTLATTALEDLYDYCNIHQGSFKDKDKGQVTTGNCFGKWDYSSPYWTEIYICKEVVFTYLNKNYKGKADEILSEWHSSGYTEHEKNRRTKRARFNGPPVECVAIRREALKELGIVDADKNETDKDQKDQADSPNGTDTTTDQIGESPE